MDALEGKNKQYRKQLTKLGGNKVLRSSPCVAMFVVSLQTLNKSRTVSRDHLGDHAMPRAEVHFRAQISHGNITVLSHLKVVRVKEANIELFLTQNIVLLDYVLYGVGNVIFLPPSFRGESLSFVGSCVF